MLTTKAFVAWLQKNPSSRAPVFWTGKTGGVSTKDAADLLKTNAAITGRAGGYTVLDAVQKSGIQTSDWTWGEDWSAACAAFAAFSQPVEKRAFLVYGKEVQPVLNIWKNDEWPSLLRNSHITDVETYLMGEDGKIKFKQEIKRSGLGNVIKSSK
ncbi:hypothetical protein C0991_008698 [Blastosporella zonata]|nr:hypothetical protein C0991_008698 [Blastosporella zonata]